jgi:hypothetical protein
LCQTASFWPDLGRLGPLVFPSSRIRTERPRARR